MFSNIPQELRDWPQWVCWRYEDAGEGKKPTKKPYNPRTGALASPTDYNTWSSFDEACNAANCGHYSGIGFVLTESDPFCFIDLDDTRGNAEAWQLQQQIFSSFESYAELSPSGTGLHIICKGSLPSGKRQGSIELYSSARYMTMTGNVYRDMPIAEVCPNTLYSLWEHLGGAAETAASNVVSLAQSESDEEVIRRAASASNSAKFIDLLNGNWHAMYASQSEADFAFVDILAFYSDNKEQVARIFRASELGKRNKQTTVKGVPYVEHMVNRSFDRKLPPVDMSGLQQQVEQAIQAKAEHRKPGRPKKHRDEQPTPYSVPPGLVGRIAQFIHDAAPRPVPEIALAGAIGLVAGMAGRAYNVSGTGLNQYILLLARTGTGKEAIGAGISTLISEVKKFAPTAPEFIGPSVIASPQALIKKLAKHKSFVSLIGEFGLKLQQMTGRTATAADRGIMTAMLDLFNKSGKGATLGSMAYSDADKDVGTLDAPAFSILGESTAESFFEGIDERSIKSGLVPRFTVIEYKGDRPDLNEKRASVAQCMDLVDAVAKFAGQCAMLNHQSSVIDVQLDSEADRIFREFNIYVDNQIRGKEDASREIWNRAHIKALKLAALIAVGCNWMHPIITADVANWAINVEVYNVARLLQRFDAGEIGAGMETSETRQIREVRRVVREWLTKDWQELEKYNAGNIEMFRARVVPYKFIQQRLSNIAAFRDDKRGATMALQRTLQSMSDHGDLQATKNKEKFGTHALVYLPVNPATFV